MFVVIFRCKFACEFSETTFSAAVLSIKGNELAASSLVIGAAVAVVGKLVAVEMYDNGDKVSPLYFLEAI